MCISQKLKPREKKYSNVEKECLSVKWALDTLKYYLLVTHFTLVMDHAPLVKSNQIVFVKYTWLADVNASVAKCLCF